MGSRSWDIQPRARKAAAIPAEAAPRRARSAAAPRTMGDIRPQPRPKPAEARAVPASTRNVTIARGRKPRQGSREPLKKRRKKARKSMLIALALLAFVMLAGVLYAAWLPAFRVTQVSASGARAQELRTLALAELSGTRFLVLPRDSLLFIPETDVRARILAEFPDAEAVSVSMDGLNTLVISVIPRAEAFVWCGTSPETADGACYEANAEGLIFAALSPETASTTAALRVYAPLEGEEGDSPIRAHVGYASRVPEALRFVKAMQSLGADVVSLSIRGDEADLRTASGTRITYVLGKEEMAAGIAASAFPQLDVNDGSLMYVDLRFEGKAHFKRAVPQEAE